MKWITREGPKIGRLACPWLIKKIVDKDAEFIYVPFNQVLKQAKNVDGNGWGILAYQFYSDSLTVLQCENHEKLTQWGCIPLLVIDVWELRII